MLDIKCCGKKFTENSQFHPGNRMTVQRGEEKKKNNLIYKRTLRKNQ